MAGTNIVFAGNSLQTANILTDSIVHESIPTKDIKAYALAHANYTKQPFTSYPSKSITVTGKVIDSSIAGLDARLDTFRGYFRDSEQNLDIDYGGSTRRYIASVNSISIDRPGGLTYAIFTIEFLANQPFGQNIATTNALALQTGRTLGTYTDPYTFLGTAPWQLPLFTLTFTDPISSSTNMVTNPGFEVDTSGWSSGGIGTFTRVTTQHNTGVAAGQMVNAASSPLTVPVANTYGWELYPLSGLTPGVTYTVKIWLKGNAGGESVRVQSVSSTPVITALTTGWQQVSFTFTAGFSTDQIYVYSTTASATWFIDDVSVVANTSATVFVGNAANGQGIYVTRAWIPADILVIDVLNKSVTVNGNVVAFSGAFPEFPPGAQNFAYQDNLISRTFNEVITYYPMYL